MHVEQSNEDWTSWASPAETDPGEMHTANDWHTIHALTYPSPFVQQHTTEFFTQTFGSPGDQCNFTSHV